MTLPEGCGFLFSPNFPTHPVQAPEDYYGPLLLQAVSDFFSGLITRFSRAFFNIIALSHFLKDAPSVSFVRASRRLSPFLSFLF